MLCCSVTPVCPTLCDPRDGSPPGSAAPGILQARTLEWAAIAFSNAWKWRVKVKSLSYVRPSATPWTAAFQAPLPMGFSRQEYWSGVPLPSPQHMAGILNFIHFCLPMSTVTAFLPVFLTLIAYFSIDYFHQHTKYLLIIPVIYGKTNTIL